MIDACATCAETYDSPINPASEKPLLPGRSLACCGRSICARCLNQNTRYETYCPYCQISSAPSSLPQGLRDPPAYSTIATPPSPPPAGNEREDDDKPPAYSANGYVGAVDQKQKPDEPTPDVLHFVSPNDSMHSLALAYGVPINALRKTNNVFSDHLLQGRRTILVPGEYYKGGVSLSPRPIEGEEEEVRRGKIRKWMVTCKVAEYDVALLYLDNAEWNLDSAIESYREDERWEKEHPLQAKERIKGKGKAAKDVGMRRFVGGSATTGMSSR